MIRALSVFLLTLACAAAPLPAQETAITYQGQLRESGEPVTDTVDLRFELFDALSGGDTIAGPLQFLDWPVEDGLFQVELDFGAVAFDGGPRFLEVEVNGAPLSPRQKVTATPFALLAAGTATGAVDGAAIDPAEVQLRVGGACPAGQSIRQIGQDGSVTCEADDIGASGWNLTGNAGTDPSTNFIGTTDASALELRTANVRGLRIEPSAELFDGLPITANVIAGSHANEVSPGVRGATIAGGGVPGGDSDPDFNNEFPNRVTGHYGTVGGGFANQAGNDNGNAGSSTSNTVGGGLNNRAFGSVSTVGGGSSNLASGAQSTVGGGVLNRATGDFSTVSGGTFNRASGVVASVGGGDGNTASGGNSTVSGGSDNCAGGSNSWAGGRRAKIRPGDLAGDPGEGCDGVPVSNDIDGDEGTFVWADDQFSDFLSSGPNQFLVRAEGGMGINTNAPETSLHVLGPSPDADPFGQLRLEGDETDGAAGTGGGISFLGHDGGIRRIWGYVQSVKENDTVGNTRSRMSFYTRGVSGLPVERVRINSNGATFNGAGVWATFSDERLKRDIEPLAGALDRLLQLKGTRFEYTDPAAAMSRPGPRMGFVAQQVEQVFPEWVDEDTRGYKFVTPTGFQALTVEALRELRDEKNAAIVRLERANEKLRNRVAALQERQDAEVIDLRAELAALRELVAPRVAEAGGR